MLIEWGLSLLVDDAVLLVSELLTNALKASWTLKPPTPIVLRLLANDRQLIIEAWDQWVENFDLNRRSSDAEHGRGLQVVTALSKRWGVGRISESYKAVWCEMSVAREYPADDPAAAATLISRELELEPAATASAPPK